MSPLQLDQTEVSLPYLKASILQLFIMRTYKYGRANTNKVRLRSSSNLLYARIPIRRLEGLNAAAKLQTTSGT